jgi:hypothetical protein
MRGGPPPGCCCPAAAAAAAPRSCASGRPPPRGAGAAAVAPRGQTHRQRRQAPASAVPSTAFGPGWGCCCCRQGAPPPPPTQPTNRSCGLAAPFLCELRPPGQYAYEASSGGSFLYSTAGLPFAEAERTCDAAGGHLAYYSSLAEQTEVRGGRRGAAWAPAASLEGGHRPSTALRQRWPGGDRGLRRCADRAAAAGGALLPGHRRDARPGQRQQQRACGAAQRAASACSPAQPAPALAAIAAAAAPCPGRPAGPAGRPAGRSTPARGAAAGAAASPTTRRPASVAAPAAAARGPAGGACAGRPAAAPCSARHHHPGATRALPQRDQGPAGQVAWRGRRRPVLCARQPVLLLAGPGQQRRRLACLRLAAAVPGQGPQRVRQQLRPRWGRPRARGPHAPSGPARAACLPAQRPRPGARLGAPAVLVAVLQVHVLELTLELELMLVLVVGGGGAAPGCASHSARPCTLHPPPPPPPLRRRLPALGRGGVWRGEGGAAGQRRRARVVRGRAPGLLV